MQYTKLPITPSDAVSRLSSKGLHISNRQNAEKIIKFISYFRLRGYCLPFMQTAPVGHLYGTRVFVPGTTWEHIQQALECDRVIRHAISSQLERIEIAFRSVLVDHMAHEYDAFFYSNFNYSFADKPINHMDWLLDVLKEIKRSGEHPIKQYFKTYTTPPLPPSWYLTEAVTFTRWSLFYNMLNVDKGKIANSFQVPPMVLESWMHCLSVLRNMCAHHSRLFGKKLTLQPMKFNKFGAEFSDPNLLYTQLVVIKILINVIDNNSELADILRNLPSQFPLVDLKKSYGIPPDWHLRRVWL